MKRNLMHFLLSALLCVGSLAAYAQNVKVRGQLVDAETGEPLIGASVVVEGTTQGSVTDIDGYFTQSAPANATIVFSYVGYQEQRQCHPDATRCRDPGRRGHHFNHCH